MNPTSNCSHGGVGGSDVFRSPKQCRALIQGPELFQVSEPTGSQWTRQTNKESRRILKSFAIMKWCVQVLWEANQQKFLHPTNKLSFRHQTSRFLRHRRTLETALLLSCLFLSRAVRQFRASVLSLQLKSKQVQTNEIKKWFNISDHTERIKVKNTIITLFPHLDGATSSQGNRGRSFSSCLLSADASPLIRSLCLKLHVHKWICSPSRRALIIFQRKNLIVPSKGSAPWVNARENVPFRGNHIFRLFVHLLHLRLR